MGSREFLEQIQPWVLSRQETEIVESAEDKVWVLQEAPIPYRAETGPKNRR